MAWLDRLKAAKRDVKRRRAVRSAHVIFLSPGKSGRTWVRAMLSHACHLRFGTPPDLLLAGDNLHRLDQRIPKVQFLHGSKQHARVRRELTAEGLRDKVVVVMLRDPRDVLVSRFHHLHNRSAHYRRLADSNPSLERPPIGSFVLAGRRLEKLVGLINAFKALTDDVPQGHLFQYEAIQAEPEAEIARLAEAIGCDLPHLHIRAAVEFARIDNLREREAEYFCRSDILRPAEPGTPNSFKVRRGKIGGFRDELSADEIAELDRRIDALLVPGLGYRSDEGNAEPAAVAS
jgi:hypothetical protein